MHRRLPKHPWRRLMVNVYRVAALTTVDAAVTVRRNWEYALITIGATIAAGLLSAAIYGIAQQVN